MFYVFLSSFMLGVTAHSLVEWFSFVQQLSWSFSCPLYCGSSFLPWFVAGFSVGFLSCLISVFLLFGFFHRTILLWLFPVSTHPGPHHPGPSLSRLRGYLHGRQTWQYPSGSLLDSPDTLSSRGFPYVSCGSLGNLAGRASWSWLGCAYWGVLSFGIRLLWIPSVWGW